MINSTFFTFGGPSRFGGTTTADASHTEYMLASDTMMAEQMLSDRPHSPELRLLSACFHNAINTIRRQGVVKKLAGPAARAEAINWILSDEETSPFDFLVLAQHLKLEPDMWRRWAREEKAKLAPPKPPKPIHYIGVQCDPRTGHWYAHIGKKNQYLGTYATAEEAARARDEAAVRMYGVKTKLNFAQKQLVKGAA